MSQYLKSISRYPFLFSLILNILLTAILYSFFSPVLFTNDDGNMLLRVSGKIIMSPGTAYILYSNILIGYLLKSLYYYFNNFPWYGIYLIGTLLISHTVFCFSFIKKFGVQQGFLFFLIYFLGCGAFVLLVIQFTIVAYLCCCAGLILFFLTLPDDDKILFSNHPKKIIFVGVIFLLTWSSLIRFECFISGILLCSIILLRTLLSNKINLIPIIAAIILCFILNFTNNYMDENYYGGNNKFNVARGLGLEYRMTENFSSKNKSQLIKTVGWSENDYTVAKASLFLDEKVYSLNQLNKFNAQKDWTLAKINFKAIVVYQLLFIKKYYVELLPVLFLLLCSFLFINLKKIIRVYIGFSIGVIFILLLQAIEIFLKNPNIRMLYPFCLTTVLLMVFYFPVNEKINFSLKYMVCLSVVFFIFILKDIERVLSINGADKNKIVHSIELRENYSPLIDITSTSATRLNPLKNITENSDSIFNLTFTLKSKPDSLYMQKISGGTLKEAIFFTRFKMLIDNERAAPFIKMLTLFAKEHYHRELHSVIVKSNAYYTVFYFIE